MPNSTAILFLFFVLEPQLLHAQTQITSPVDLQNIFLRKLKSDEIWWNLMKSDEIWWKHGFHQISSDFIRFVFFVSFFFGEKTSSNQSVWEAFPSLPLIKDPKTFGCIPKTNNTARDPYKNTITHLHTTLLLHPPNKKQYNKAPSKNNIKQWTHLWLQPQKKHLTPRSPPPTQQLNFFLSSLGLCWPYSWSFFQCSFPRPRLFSKNLGQCFAPQLLFLQEP